MKRYSLLASIAAVGGAVAFQGKPANWKGKYLRPDLYNVASDRGIFYTAPAAGPLASDNPSPVVSQRGGGAKRAGGR